MFKLSFWPIYVGCKASLNWPLSPMVADEGVSGLRVGVGVHGGHTAVHIEPQRNMVALEDRCLQTHHVTQEENIRRSLRLPVL